MRVTVLNHAHIVGFGFLTGQTRGGERGRAEARQGNQVATAAR